MHRPLNSVPVPLHTVRCGPWKAPTQPTPDGELQPHSQTEPPVALLPLRKLLQSRSRPIAWLTLRPGERAPERFRAAQSTPMYQPQTPAAHCLLLAGLSTRLSAVPSPLHQSAKTPTDALRVQPSHYRVEIFRLCQCHLHPGFMPGDSGRR